MGDGLYYARFICGYGGIGRRAGFRFLCRKVYGFDSHYPHQWSTYSNLILWNQLLIDQTKKMVLRIYAGVVELADAADSKSAGSNTVWVQVPPSAPILSYAGMA